MRKRIIKVEYRERSLDGIIAAPKEAVFINYVSNRREVGLEGVTKKRLPRKPESRRISQETRKRLSPLRHKESTNYFSLVSKFTAVFLIIGFGMAAIASIGSTMSIFSDTESSKGNLFESGLLDFELELSPFNNTAWTNLTIGTSTAQDIDVMPNLLSNPFFYHASSTNFTGDLDFCEGINVSATLAGPQIYSGPLVDFLTASTTVLNIWNLEFSTNEEFINAVCHFDIDFNGWQTRHDYPEFDNGFSDTEKTEHWLFSPGIRINKVYFEIEKEECDKKHHKHGYKDDHKDDCDEGEDEKITICHATSSEVNPWVRLVVNLNGFNGHFEENGTPLAGHEEDILLAGDVECPLPDENDSNNDGRHGRKHGRGVHVENDNNATTTTNASSTSNTGGNSTSGGEGAEGGDGGDGGGEGGDGGSGADGGTIKTGDATSTVEINNTINENIFDSGVGKKKKDIEWVELYNQTSVPVDINGWFLCDAQECDELLTDELIPPNGFALIIPDEEVLKQWEVPDDFVVIIISDGTIGDGLDNGRDALFLRRPDSEILDQLNWGDPNPAWPNYNDFLWVPGTPSAPDGSMLARIPTGFDTNEPTDWHILSPPVITLLYPGYIVPHPWFWEYIYAVTWEAENCSGSDGDLLIDIILIRDSNHNNKIDDEDERILLVEGTENDGLEEILIPEGFIGKVWLRLVAVCSVNPMAQDFDTSGRTQCSFPSYYLDDENKKKIVEDAILEQMEWQGTSEYSTLLPAPDSETVSEVDIVVVGETPTEIASTTASTTVEIFEEVSEEIGEEVSTATTERRERIEREGRTDSDMATTTDVVVVNDEEPSTLSDSSETEEGKEPVEGELPVLEDLVIKEEELNATNTEEVTVGNEE